MTTCYLDYDTGRLYTTSARTRLLTELACKYGDTLALRLVILDTAGAPVDIGTDTLRLGARLSPGYDKTAAPGTMALYLGSAAYKPDLSGQTVTPAYEMQAPLNTDVLQAALADRAYVHLDLELERETYEGQRRTSQTITLHVEQDIISTAASLGVVVDVATEEWVRGALVGVTAGTIPQLDLTSVKMVDPDSSPAAILKYDSALNKYTISLLIPTRPGARGEPGVTPTFTGGVITTTPPGTHASMGLRDLGGNVYALDISVPLAKGDQGDEGPVGPAPRLSIGTVSAGATPGADITADGVGAYKLHLTLQPGPQGVVGPPPTLKPGTITTGAAGTSVSAALRLESPGVYLLDLTIPRGAQGIQGIKGDPGNLTDLLGLSNIWTATQIIGNGKSLSFRDDSASPGSSALRRLVTQYYYTGFAGLALFGAPYFMIYAGSDERSNFTWLAPAGEIVYSTTGGDQRKTFRLPRNDASSGRILVSTGAETTWADKINITPTAWANKPDNEVMTKAEFLAHCNAVK